MTSGGGAKFPRGGRKFPGAGAKIPGGGGKPELKTHFI